MKANRDIQLQDSPGLSVDGVNTLRVLKTERAGERFCVAIKQGHISD